MKDLTKFDEISVEEMNEKINNSKKESSEIKIALLRHYLVNLILYQNVPYDDRDDSPIKQKLLEICILLDKLQMIESKISSFDPHRIVEDRMMKEKSKSAHLKTSNPKKKFRINSENQKERTKPKEDYNIDVKSSKAKRFGQ